MRKIGINAPVGFDADVITTFKKIKAAGFDAVTTGWNDESPVEEWAAAARELSLEYTFLHAPFGRVHKLWDEGPEGDEYTEMLMRGVDCCAKNGIPIMICHVFIGFGEEHPTDKGIERFGRLLDHAEKMGVKIAFENTEGEAYLEYLKEKLWDRSAAGFCIDTGHEMCYNYSKDLIGKYGDKLITTHINDNLGILGEKITPQDDLHLLPYDGILNVEALVQRIKNTPFEGTLIFEVFAVNKKDKHYSDKYIEMGIDAYLALAYERARKIAELFE